MPDSPNGSEIDKVSPETDVKKQAEPSTAVEGDKPTMLDAVTSALEAQEESPASDKPDPEKAEADEESAAQKFEEGEAEAEPEAEDDEFTEEERAQLSEKTQRRMKKLVGDVKTLQAENETFKPKAESFDRIVQFAQANQLNKADVDNTFQIAALVKNDPVKALEALTPIVDELRRITGNVVPDDLQKQIREGYITREHAAELARSRAQQQLQATQAEEARKREAEQKQRDEAQTGLNAAIQAADDWYAKQQSKDPDFELKRGRLAEKAELEAMRSMQKGKLLTAQETVEVLDRIKREVDTEYRKLTPSRPAVTPVDGNASAGSKPAPKTMLEAIEGAIAG